MTNSKTTGTECLACGARTNGTFCDQCGRRITVGACAVCHGALPVGSRFCSDCGSASVAQQFANGPLRATDSRDRAAAPVASYLPWGIAAILLVSATGYFAGRNFGGSEPDTSALSSAPFAMGNPAPVASGAAPDINNMSPRERASRLYDRIMRYSEEGNKDSLQFFAPMALASFELLGPELDLDARYDYGRVASETGNLLIAASQADTILAQAPTHLLGLALAARAATSRGDAKSAQASWKAFLNVRESELKKNLPEYQMHSADIAQATKIAGGT